MRRGLWNSLNEYQKCQHDEGTGPTFVIRTAQGVGHSHCQPNLESILSSSHQHGILTFKLKAMYKPVSLTHSDRV